MAIGPVYRPLLELCREANVDIASALRDSELTEAEILDPNTRIPTERARAFGKRLIALVGDPELGLRAAERFRPEDADLVGYLVRHSPNLIEALIALARYVRLLGDAAEASVERADGRVTVTIGLAGGRRYLPEAADFIVAVLVRGVREITGDAANLVEVRLARPEPREREPYRRYFRAPIVFDAEQNTVVYGEAALGVPFRESDPRLRAILERRAEDVLATLPAPQSLAEHVRASIGRRLGLGEVGLGTVARDLAVSERTLRRRLRESGLSYRVLLDAVRSERALSLVAERRYTVTMMAQLLGFSDATSFARAFRRWTGSLPHEYTRNSLRH